MVDEFEGELRRNPPLRNDQHPRLAKTVPIQLYVSFSVSSLAFIITESESSTLTHTVAVSQAATSMQSWFNQ